MSMTIGEINSNIQIGNSSNNINLVGNCNKLIIGNECTADLSLAAVNVEIEDNVIISIQDYNIYKHYIESYSNVTNVMPINDDSLTLTASRQVHVFFDNIANSTFGKYVDQFGDTVIEKLN